MKKWGLLGCRVLLGLIYFVFGLNGFFNFIPVPPMPEHVEAFMGALFKTGYMFPMIKTVEVWAGLALLSNRYKALFLVLVSPILVNIVAFHLFMAPDGLPIAIAMLLMQGTLMWHERNKYRPIFQAI